MGKELDNLIRLATANPTLVEYRSEVISNVEELGHELRRIEEGTNTACAATVDSIRRTFNRLKALNSRMAKDYDDTYGADRDAGGRGRRIAGPP